MVLITSLRTRQVVHARTAPAAGTKVVVRMIDTVDSALAQNVQARATGAVSSMLGTSVVM